MDLPDIVGFDMEEAMKILDEKGFIVKEVLTAKPVKATKPLGTARVIRLSHMEEGEVRVVVAYQDYGKEV